MYTFKPMSNEQLESESLIDEGNYDFEVLTATRKISKSGNNMAELKLIVWDKDGQENTIFDYLVFSSKPLNIKKIKHFCESVGLFKEYEQGEIPEELNGYSGKVKIGIQDETINPNGGTYSKRNIVIDYLLPDSMSILNQKKSESEIEDNIPF